LERVAVRIVKATTAKARQTLATIDPRRLRFARPGDLAAATPATMGSAIPVLSPPTEAALSPVGRGSDSDRAM
jgi:hypothetical protein